MWEKTLAWFDQTLKARNQCCSFSPKSIATGGCNWNPKLILFKNIGMTKVANSGCRGAPVSKPAYDKVATKNSRFPSLVRHSPEACRGFRAPSRRPRDRSLPTNVSVPLARDAGAESWRRASCQCVANQVHGEGEQ